MASAPPTTPTVSGLSVNDRDKLLAAVNESLFINSGRGSYDFRTQTILSEHDRFRSSPIQINSEMVGLTFITKPRLNLTTSSLRQDPHLAMLDTLDPLSLMFAIRCNLDTVFMRSGAGRTPAANSPWVNDKSPFNIPLGNMLVGMSGWPDYNLEYETTESGYFAEDMTLARGSDRGRRTYDIVCTFRDIQGGYLMAYLFYWIHAMALQMEGSIVAYPDDREANRLNYTCSIYRFVMDPSMTTILKWAKATGCYPVSLPIGDVFNFGPEDSFIHTSQQFSVPFKVNNVTYMDPRHLQAFNILMQRYAGSNFGREGSRVVTKAEANLNFKGLPFIELIKGTNELMFLATKEELVDRSQSVVNEILASVKNSAGSSLQSLYTTTPQNA